MKKNSNFYWIIILMLLFATALSFLDRQVLSISIIKIIENLGITDTQYGFINSGFLISYAIMFTLGGVLIDRYGSRWGLGISVAFWSIATALHGMAMGTVHFALFRFLLGIGEGGCFPGAVKAVIEWVPKKKQALANGIAIGGSAIGAMVALPACAYFLGNFSWRYLFLFAGIIGIVWTLSWFLLTREKNVKRYAQGSIATTYTTEKSKSFSWKNTFNTVKSKNAIIFIIIRFLLDPIFYFFMFWIPKYLSDSRGLELDTIGYITWIPFLALGIANVAGGWLSDIAYNKSGSVNFARKMVMGLGAAFTVPVFFVGMMDSTILIICAMTSAFFGHGLWITNYITFIGDIFGKSSSSTIVGVSGSAGAVSSLVINPLLGKIIVSYSYATLWVYSGIMYPVAFVILLLFIPKIQLSEK